MRNVVSMNTGRPRRRKSPRKPPTVVTFLVVFAVTILATQGYLSGWFTGISSKIVDNPMPFMSSTNAVTATGEHVDFSFCHSMGGHNCVVDGDTIWLHGEKIRLADYYTPETHDYKCKSEKELGDRATQRLHELLESGPITLETIDRDTDQYGRSLRIVRVNGRSVGDTLVGEGLARWYRGGRQPWC